MNGERPTIQERLRVAFESDDLTVSAERRGDADYLIALGIAEQGSSAVAAQLMRLYRGCNPAELRQAKASVLALTARLSRSNGWALSYPSLARVAELAIGHYVLPTCQHCEGRGHMRVPGTPHLSARPCSHCSGTGKRPIQKRNGDKVRAVLADLERSEDEAARAVRRLMR